MISRALISPRRRQPPPETPQRDSATPTLSATSVRRLAQQLDRWQHTVNSMHVAQNMRLVLPVPMRNQYAPEAFLSLNREHFTGLHDVITQLGSYAKVPVHICAADLQDAAQFDTVSDISIGADAIAKLTKKDGTPLVPLVYMRSDIERAAHRIEVGSDNRLRWHATGRYLKKGQFICVWGPDRRMYAVRETTPGQKREYRHSSFFAGAPVLFAGEIETNDSGRLVSVNNKSGHYRPGFASWVDFLLFLGAQGVRLPRVRKLFVNKTDRNLVQIAWLQQDGVDTGQVRHAVELRPKKTKLQRAKI